MIYYEIKECCCINLICKYILAKIMSNYLGDFYINLN